MAISSDLLTPGISAASIGFEVYYVQVKIKMYGTEQELRIYMSDDDFTDEGSRGHHQGDITYFDGSNVEHWANGGSNWLSNPSGTTTRGNFANGAGETDSETGHARGMFGDRDLWDAAKFKQGSGQDIFHETSDLSGSDSSLNLTFGVQSSWFYEDFERTTYPNSFDPCLTSVSEACAVSGEWAPLLPTVTARN